ncbi:MAG: TetR/AcrR family transcriptional regulator, partial [Chloroflexi bacterium]|nr:TetR/AcrR family transcriptional regulator [Chloroflexota bacterium]
MPRIARSARKTLTETRRAQILRAASKVFARKGFERATIAEVAKAAGVSPGLIYTYFKNKGDLLVSIPRQLMQPGVEPLRAEVMRAPADQPDTPEHVLTVLATNMTRIAHQHTDFLRVMLTSLPTMSAAARARFFEQVPLFALGTLEGYFQQQ